MSNSNQSPEQNSYVADAMEAERFAQSIRDACDAAAFQKCANVAQGQVSQLTTQLAASKASEQRASAALAAKKAEEERQIAAAKKAEEEDWAEFKTIGGVILLGAAAFILIWLMKK